MKNNTEPKEANREYTAAHEAHYTTKDLHKALGLYKGVMATHPNTQEADYARTQIFNIVKSVVPEQELLDAQIELTLANLEHKGAPDVEPA